MSERKFRSKVSVAGLALSGWLIISPWVLGFSGLVVARVNVVLIGVIMALAWLWVWFYEKE